MKNNHHSNTYLQNAWNKYGEQNFEFYPIESFELIQKEHITKETLDKLEEKYIKKLDTFENGFNLTTGGEKCKMSHLSDESKRKIGEKNRVNMIGRKATIETKQRMSISHKEIMKSELHRKHLSDKLTGIKRSDEHKEKLRLANQGSKSSLAKYNEDLIEKIRIDYMQGIQPIKLSEKYNINKGTLRHIIQNRTWKHVTPNGWEEFLASRSK